ncbi:exodeoxyribonuclease V subunit alpha [Pararcticibacter amylolyticus]|uniref:RecBCD enzyme subunit RecD n=1 Tax=Pararcticibacter amylolyticus TaxID=2173175 RepID=A0A2U2PAZ6_9SPHI|nr:exodeoxyribonuclease V subunit alpha [Pararcticibacter amylolyticus]
MTTTNDVHLQFAGFFRNETLRPYAWLVSKKLSEGHICLKLDDLETDMEILPEYFSNAFRAPAALAEEPMVGHNPGDRKPFILYNNNLYLHKYFNYETRILNRIQKFRESEDLVLEERSLMLGRETEFLSTLFPPPVAGSLSAAMTDWQMVAAISAVLNNFTIITGGPGTGKTTTVARILALLYKTDPDLKVALAAPTGKAAARMAESLRSASFTAAPEIAAGFQKLEPLTIHRLLKYVPDSAYFKHHQDNPLRYDVIIVDESSMIDAALFAKLLDATGDNTRLILLGDKDQLASVEAGSLFGDLCQSQTSMNVFSRERAQLINSLISEPFRQLQEEHVGTLSQNPLFQHIIELKFSRRFSGEEGIGKFSKAVISNDRITIQSFIAKPDAQVTVDPEYSQIRFEEFIREYEDYIREQDILSALRKMNTIRVLCATREGNYGVFQLNRRIEKYLEQKRLIRLNAEFYENRPVMVTSNNYTVGLYNGDTGIVRSDEKGTVKVWFEDGDGKLKSVLPGYISQAETVFAMTIHKSQGSEFKKVLVMLPPEQDVEILTRELLYTGVTRARTFVLVQGQENVILKAAERHVKRASGLGLRLNLPNG